MKLRNKRTGEIQELTVTLTGDIVIEQDGERIAEISSLAELNEEWEDAPEEYWYIDYDGGILCGESDNSSAEKMMISMGNHFETIEEAEKAVEKLKCFTNLKNHEFMFDGWYYGTDGNIVILANAHEFNDMEEQDLTKVFGEKIC